MKQIFLVILDTSEDIEEDDILDAINHECKVFRSEISVHKLNDIRVKVE